MYYEIEKMDGYWRIGSPEMVFCYVLEGTERAMLIDTGYGFSDIRGAVRSITDKPLIIINTHGHCDHTGGNHQFEEVCYIHEDDIALCRKHNSEAMRRSNALRCLHSMDYETGKEYSALPDDFDMDAYARGGFGRLEPVSEGTVFDLGGITAEILKTPGHTAGGISVRYREKNLVFIGDATGFFVWLHLPESTDQQSYLEMIDALYAIGADGYIGGHNADMMHKEDLLRYRRAAMEADFSAGEVFHTFLDEGREAHVCALPGMTMEDMFRPDFASVVITEDWGENE